MASSQQAAQKSPWQELSIANTAVPYSLQPQMTQPNTQPFPSFTISPQQAAQQAPWQEPSIPKAAAPYSWPSQMNQLNTLPFSSITSSPQQAAQKAPWQEPSTPNAAAPYSWPPQTTQPNIPTFPSIIVSPQQAAQQAPWQGPSIPKTAAPYSWPSQMNQLNTLPFSSITGSLQQAAQQAPRQESSIKNAAVPYPWPPHTTQPAQMHVISSNTTTNSPLQMINIFGPKVEIPKPKKPNGLFNVYDDDRFSNREWKLIRGKFNYRPGKRPANDPRPKDVMLVLSGKVKKASPEAQALKKTRKQAAQAKVAAQDALQSPSEPASSSASPPTTAPPAQLESVQTSPSLELQDTMSTTPFPSADKPKVSDTDNNPAITSELPSVTLSSSSEFDDWFPIVSNVPPTPPLFSDGELVDCSPINWNEIPSSVMFSNGEFDGFSSVFEGIAWDCLDNSWFDS
ncbi:uncharacterized protein PV09_03853 [Verruconis gallopava]|uniref:Uncharacterized protein n=1 Tax=Verruconis gallopava TaxID=253628 RepID=A0A0D2B1Z1_9PEZI|nr:uncharacterized protein PV09_03853 [Verruconis gallopava]KIW05334.1 hypothetical protein PV09_03853 [Verruconis gallopava]